MCRLLVPRITLTVSLSIICLEHVLALHETAPHIIVFMADDLGWNDVSFHGSNQIPTPNIDALGYNGIILNRHYVLPSSTPSRTAFFTGKYPIRLGMQGDDIRGGEPRGLPLDVRILPEHLRGLGYTTKLIGKWHMGYYTSQHTPLHRGFDAFLGFYNGHISYFNYSYSHQVGSHFPGRFVEIGFATNIRSFFSIEGQNMSGYDMHRGDVPAYGLTGEYVTDLFTEEAIRIIQDHELPRPLYLQISHLAVHLPLQPPRDRYTSRDFLHINEQNRRMYARMVDRLDDSVGRIFQALGNKGMLRDSLILFLTDNGAAPVGRFMNWGSNYPLRGAKYTLYEGGVRGVAALWSPRLQKAARISNQLVHISDWLPTLYSVAGGDIKDLGEIDGIDQWRALSEMRGQGRDKLLLNIDEVQKTEGAIYSRFKLLRGSIEGGFYDGYYGDSGATGELIHYADMIMNSSITKSITSYLGGPVTQPSMIAQLRKEATVNCRPNRTYHTRHRFTTCNVTECLFDIVNDPCETMNVADQYSRFAKDLDILLESYGQKLVKQVKVPVDWLADPRRSNGTWEPWISVASLMNGSTKTAVSFVNIVCFVHISAVIAAASFTVFLSSN